MQMSNGSYNYSIATVNKKYSASGGSFIVNGANTEISVKFILVTYTITFTESGLSYGTSWSIILNNVTKFSTNNTIIFIETNGSYYYIVQSIAGYRSNTYMGNIIVNGNAVSNSIVWSIITYPITITQSGIPSGTTWSVTLTGKIFNGQNVNITLTSINSTLIFNESNGTYSYTVHLPSGYQGTNLKGSLTVAGSKVITNIKANATTNYLLIEIIIVIVVILAVIAGIFVMKRGKKKGGSKQWQSPYEKIDEEKK